MAEFTAKAVGDRISLSISDDNGRTATIEANTHSIFDILQAIYHELRELPVNPSNPIPGQKPVMRSIQPSFQIGASSSTGDVVLVIRPDPLPPMEFYFDDERLQKLIEGLNIAAAIPRHLRTNKTPQ